MQFVRFITAGTLAALATAIALDADATPPQPPRVVTAEQIFSAVDEAQAMANQIDKDDRAER
ncbi:hypothetical protein E2493_08995 [Sphingomonas parva]|uniref:Uncharacterized protein n=1 Tax=Sphingomonas parva TaxID=2555898 RepID=A0A4Y8ZRB5_9SPHN|nr:hypothetical protein [Sphingomonas parva]TFI58551.1 hypothetical protein E2493_08995 [Sphingomonas parva]